MPIRPRIHGNADIGRDRDWRGPIAMIAVRGLQSAFSCLARTYSAAH